MLLVTGVAFFASLTILFTDIIVHEPRWSRPATLDRILPPLMALCVALFVATTAVLSKVNSRRASHVLACVAGFMAVALLFASPLFYGFLSGPDVDGVWRTAEYVGARSHINLETSARLQFPGFYLLISCGSLVAGVDAQLSQALVFLQLLMTLLLCIVLLSRKLGSANFMMSLTLFVAPLSLVFTIQAAPQGFAYVLFLLTLLLLESRRNPGGTMLVLVMLLAVVASHPLTPLFVIAYMAAWVLLSSRQTLARARAANLLLLAAVLAFAWYLFIAVFVLASVGRNFLAALGQSLQRGLENAAQARSAVLTPNLADPVNFLAVGSAFFMLTIFVAGILKMVLARRRMPPLYGRLVVSVLLLSAPLLLLDLMGNRVADRLALVAMPLVIISVHHFSLVKENHRKNSPKFERHLSQAKPRIFIVLVLVLSLGTAFIFQAAARTNSQFILPSDRAAYEFVDSNWTASGTLVSGLAAGYLLHSYEYQLLIPISESTNISDPTLKAYLIDNYMFTNYAYVVISVQSRSATGGVDEVYDSGNAQIYLSP
jgi:uncharacterized membrane protein